MYSFSTEVVCQGSKGLCGEEEAVGGGDWGGDEGGGGAVVHMPQGK